VKNKRKKIWIDRFQSYLSLRLALYFAVYTIIVWLWAIIDRITASLLVEAHFEYVGVYWSVLSVGTLLAVGLLFIYDMVCFSHRIAGPLYRFRKQLQAIKDGEELEMMVLRKDDFLQDLKDEFNEALKALEERGAVTFKTNAVNEDCHESVPGPR
jgi:signal transduction histidine kinase